MGLRPGRCYRKLKRPYTRQSQRKPKKGYVKGVPVSKLHTFEMGKQQKDFTLIVNLTVDMPCQIRHNALEAARIAANKSLNKLIGEDGYFMKILVFPHHVMRENSMATGAGADRFQSGMRLAFGRPAGTAARVLIPNQSIFEVRTKPGNYPHVKRSLKIACSKLPIPCSIKVKSQ